MTDLTVTTNTNLAEGVTTNYIPAKNMNPFFDVTRCPLSTTFNGQPKDVARDALFSPNGDLLGVVSPKYNLVENKDVKAVFDEFFSSLNVYSVTDKVSGNGGKWLREYVLNEDKYTVHISDKKEEIAMKVTIGNGYDGKTSVFMNFSAWRQVCSNGMMGWKKMIGRKFNHFTNDILDHLKNEIDKGFNGMSNNFETWEKWSKEKFTKNQFEGFVNSREYLSDKQKNVTNGLYIPVMNKFNEEETKWGAYNVLTAIATHHTQSRNKNVANDFSNGFRVMNRVTRDFYEYV